MTATRVPVTPPRPRAARLRRVLRVGPALTAVAVAITGPALAPHAIDLPLVARYTDTALVLDAARVVDAGPTPAVLARIQPSLVASREGAPR